MQHLYLIGESITEKTEEWFCRYPFKHIIHLLTVYILVNLQIVYRSIWTIIKNQECGHLSKATQKAAIFIKGEHL